MTATALVLSMTLPGLALFYDGLVRHKNVLSVMMHCVVIACLSSLAFSGTGALLGDLHRVFLLGLGRGTLPESVFAMFQMTFAIITQALIASAYTERVRFDAWSALATIAILAVTARVCGLRVDAKALEDGLDLTHHGERAFLP